MPPVPGHESVMYAIPGSAEMELLDRRWDAGDFAARVSGGLLRLFATDETAVLYIPYGYTLKLVVGTALAHLDISVDAYLAKAEVD